MRFFAALLLIAPAQEPDPRAEFERLLPTASYTHLKDVPDLIFSEDEESFLRGVKILHDLRYGSVERERMVDLNLIPFRRAREKRWARGQEAAEWFILAYMGVTDREGANRVRQRLETILKDADDPATRKTRKLMALAEGKAERSDLLDLSKDSRAEVRNFAVHRLADRNDPGDTAHLGSFLKDPDPGVRSTVIQTLGQRGAAEYADAIAEQLDGPEYFIRRVAIGAIGQMKVHRLAKRIVPFLADPTDRGGDARSWAHDALKSLDPGEAVDDVVKLFSHEEASVRKSAVSLVGHWKHKRSMPLVTTLLRDADAPVRVEAIEALVSLGATDVTGLVAQRLEDEAEPVRSRAAVALGHLGAKAQSGKIADLGREGRIAKNAAVEALLLLDARDKSAAIVDLLEAMVEAESKKTARGHGPVEDRSRNPSFTDLVKLACRKEMNDCVIEILKRIEKNFPRFRTGVLHAVSEDGTAALLKRLGEEGLLVSKEAQHNALRAFEKTLTANSVPALMDLVRALDKDVQRHLDTVERRLAEFPEAMAAYTEDKSPAVRRLAGLALCGSRQLKHLPRLVKLMDDPDPEVRAWVTQRAAYLPTTDHHDAIGRRLSDPGGWVRQAALQGVRMLKLKRFAPDVAALLSDPDASTRERALEALEAIEARDQAARVVPLLDDPKLAARAAEGLRKLGGAESLEALQKLVKGGNPEARGEAIRAIAVIGGKERLPDLDALLADKDDAVRAAGAFAVGVFKDGTRKDAIVALLKDPRHVVKTDAARALAELGARDQAAGILTLLDLPDDQPIQIVPGGHKSSRWMAEEAAVAAIVKLKAVETAPELARRLLSTKDIFATQRLGPALIRLDPKSHMEALLSPMKHQWHHGIFYELNLARAPRLYGRVGTAALSIPGGDDRGSLVRRAEILGKAFGVRIVIDPDVPEAIRNRDETIGNSFRSPYSKIVDLVPRECAALFDESGEIRIVTLEVAKQFWLDWAKSK